MKRIGIPGYKKGDDFFGVAISYIRFISQFGIPVILSPQDADNPPEVDMLYLPGGLDVNPLTYGETPDYYTQNPNILLEYFDNKILPQYLERNTPIFAVCRGAQKIWGLFGGKIIQHLDWHSQSSKHPKEEVHGLSFYKEFAELSKHINKVTSRHHQVMSGFNVPDTLEVIACATELIDKKEVPYCEIVEMFRHVEKPIVGVQFHPEDHSECDQLSGIIIKSLLNPVQNET